MTYIGNLIKKKTVCVTVDGHLLIIKHDSLPLLLEHILQKFLTNKDCEIYAGVEYDENASFHKLMLSATNLSKQLAHGLGHKEQVTADLLVARLTALADFVFRLHQEFDELPSEEKEVNIRQKYTEFEELINASVRIAAKHPTFRNAKKHTPQMQTKNMQTVIQLLHKHLFTTIVDKSAKGAAHVCIHLYTFNLAKQLFDENGPNEQWSMLHCHDGESTNTLHTQVAKEYNEMCKDKKFAPRTFVMALRDTKKITTDTRKYLEKEYQKLNADQQQAFDFVENSQIQHEYDFEKPPSFADLKLEEFESHTKASMMVQKH